MADAPRGAQIAIRKEGTLVSTTVVGNLGAGDVLLGLELAKAEVLRRAQAGAPIAVGKPIGVRARRADAPPEG